MKRTLNLDYSLFVLMVFLLLTACDGGGGGGSSPGTSTPSETTQGTATTLSGTVADGYLQGARVFLDRNGNRIWDSGEPMAISTAGGTYTLTINPGEGEKYSVVVEVIAGETIDEDDGQQVADSYLLEAPAGRWHFVSPLTTLVNLEMQKKPTMTIGDAELAVKKKLFGEESPPEISLSTDYIALKADSASGDEARRIHKAAQVVALLMGKMRNKISDGQIEEGQQKLVAYLISDEILRHGNKIIKALNQDEDSEPVATNSNIISIVEDQIASADLYSEKLDLYAQKIAQMELEPGVWDMEPPRIEQQNIQHGAIVSVDTLVTVVFDKQLNPATVTANAITLHRSDGSYVSGVIDYDANLKRLSFTPNQMLTAYNDYDIIISEYLADHLGNRLGENLKWEFKTLFDLTPPPLVDLDAVPEGL